MESDEEDQETETEGDTVETPEIQKERLIHAYLTMDNENEQEKQKEPETDEGIIGTPKEQKERLLHAYLTSTMEKEENEREEQNNRRELLHMSSNRPMDNSEVQTEQDETDTYLRTSMEEEQEPSTWEEYDEEEPFEENDEDESSKENDDEGKWMTQFSYLTKEEEDALFIAFMSGTVEDQQKWIDAKKNLARTTTNEETRRREEEIQDRIIPTGIVDLDEAFEEEDEEETDNLSECQPYDLTEDQEEDFTDEFIDKDKEDEDIQLLESLTVSYRNHEKQDEETTHPLSSTFDFDDQLIGTRHFTEPDKCWGYDNEHIKDEDKWEMAKTNRMMFEPTVIFSNPYSPTIPQTKMDETSQNQESEDLTIQTKEGQDTEDTSRSKDDDLFTKPGECTSWVTRTVYKGLINPENQPQMDQTKPQDKRNMNGQDYIDIIILPV